jgi:1-deoxy-D-xylulose-5-phosphate reductoisomerase
MKTQNVVLLGSTGSIGRQTLDVVRRLPDRFRVLGLAAGYSFDALAAQAREFAPKLLCCEHEDGRSLLESAPGATWASMEEQAAHPDADIVVVATVGKAGLAPTLAALRAGKTVALANKEVLVMAGELVTQAAREGSGELRPIDSEHSAIWQCLWGERPESVARLILTASGGAFRDLSVDELANVTPEQALQHPTWDMGPKITVDSATLMNKGFEAIEARWLFDVPLDRVDIVLHRESIVHSLVEFVDGSMKAQLDQPDMRLPIQVALTHPERAHRESARLDLAQAGRLHFAPIDYERYPAFRLALEAGRRGGTYPAVLAAADEVAVGHFLEGRLGFPEIADVVEDALSAHRESVDISLEAISAADAWARDRADGRVKARV